MIHLLRSTPRVSIPLGRTVSRPGKQCCAPDVLTLSQWTISRRLLASSNLTRLTASQELGVAAKPKASQASPPRAKAPHTPPPKPSSVTPNKSAPPALAYEGSKSTAKPATEGTQNQNAYPEQLLIYHAGSGRTMFLSFFKLTGIFVFIFGSLFIAPQYYYSATEETWVAPIVVFASAIPLLIMTFTTAPFVTYVHLILPVWARASSNRLHRYAQALPSTAMMDITTLRWIWPRVTRLRVSELYVKTTEVGTMSLGRDVPEAAKLRPWYAWRPLKSFYVAGKSRGKLPEQGVWDQALACITKGWDKPGMRGKLLVKQ